MFLPNQSQRKTFLRLTKLIGLKDKIINSN